jgi:carboxylesterase type B
MMASEHIISHPTLRCSLRGTSTSTSVQFRNLKYASIPGRYQDSIPNDTLIQARDNVVDATTFGPSCPQKRGAQAWDLTLYGNVSLPCEQGQGETEKMDEFDCLSVNVTIPKLKANETKKGLPVFVWVHGGGLSIGSNNWPQYDLQKFVDRSVEIGKPFIAVAMNYRVGLFGFLANEEGGAPGNMGFKDQVLAFQWVKKHIAGFGGDPTNVTAAGESAGAISLSTLLGASVVEEGLFDRVMLMSGEATLRKPRNKWWHRQAYNDQAAILSVESTDLKMKLWNTDAEALAQQLPLASHYCGYIDSKWLKQDITSTLMSDGQKSEHKPSWCKDFVVGDTAHDGTVLKARILDYPQVLSRLKSSCAKYLTQSETQRLLAAYKIDTNLSLEQERDTLRNLASELRFYDPVRRIHKGWKSTTPPIRCGRYHFHVPNPFEGNFKDIVSHELDVAFLLQNFNDQLDAQHRKVAKAMADHFIGFIYGEQWAGDGKVVVFGVGGVKEIEEGEYDKVYRDGRGAVLDSMDGEKLWRVAEMWQGVRSEEEEQREGEVARL